MVGGQGGRGPLSQPRVQVIATPQSNLEGAAPHHNLRETHMRLDTCVARPVSVTRPQRRHVTLPLPEQQSWCASRSQVTSGAGRPSPPGEHGEKARAPHWEGVPLALAQWQQRSHGLPAM